MSSIIEPASREPVEIEERRAVSPDWKNDIVRHQEGRCARCGEELLFLDFDHILPLALGGLHTIHNIQALCLACHKAKTREDIKRIRKAQRQQRAHLGTKPKRGPKIKSRGFQRDPLSWRD